jgi:glutathione synthase/RimK-type ligase-like ATP-grasp enzyme
LSTISILFDRSEPDELGIRLTAREMGVEMGYIPFYKVALSFGNKGLTYRSVGKDFSKKIKTPQVVLNRTQSKSRRLFASSILDTLGHRVVNSLNVEETCSSKVRTLLKLFTKGVSIPETVYVPSNVREPIPEGGVMDNTRAVAFLVEASLPDGRIVLKPDGGTHGRGISLVQGIGLETALKDVQPSIINPSGVLAQEYVPKWFYDLRIIVHKNAGGPVQCAPVAMARAGFGDFRTNTYLGNKVFHVELPQKVVETAIHGGKALIVEGEAGVLAFDAMLYFRDGYPSDNGDIKAAFDALNKPFNRIQKVKGEPLKKKHFMDYTSRLRDAYNEYKSLDAYQCVQSVIQESLNRLQDSVVLHECNACPEFWEQTQQVTDVDVARLLVEAALSHI